MYIQIHYELTIVFEQEFALLISDGCRYSQSVASIPYRYIVSLHQHSLHGVILKTHIIVKASLNTAFPDKPTFEGLMTESQAHQRCKQLNAQMRQDADFTYKPRKA